LSAGKKVAGMTSGSSTGREGTVQRRVLSEQLKDELLERIVSQDLPPGTRIVETRIAKEFGTSQAPVREALRSLASLGLVEMRPHRGAWVRQPSREELVEAVLVRGVLEAYAAELAASRITDDELAQLEELTVEMQALALAGDAMEQAHKNAEFHATVVAASRNATLARTWRMLEPYTQTYITATAPGVDLHWLASRHLEIIEALRAGDPDAASRATRNHLQQAADIKGKLAAATESSDAVPD
jgi:DNA-binding GntR family transcriptional regulator